MPQPTLIYAHDPQRGWCFGFIPALTALTRARPDIRIEVALGGLVTGARIGPFAAMADYIRAAAPRLAAVTGQHLGPPFLDGILTRTDVISSSVPPSAVIAQVRAAFPLHALDFAHAVQHALFVEGANLNDPATYPPLLAALGITLDLVVPGPYDTPPALMAEFQATRALGVTGFPTLVIRSNGGAKPLPNLYDPAALVTQIAAAFPPSNGTNGS